MVDEVVGPFAPSLAGETVVLRQQLDAGRHIPAFGRIAVGIASKTEQLAGRLIDKLRGFARREDKMGGPVPTGLS